MKKKREREGETEGKEGKEGKVNRKREGEVGRERPSQIVAALITSDIW